MNNAYPLISNTIPNGESESDAIVMRAVALAEKNKASVELAKALDALEEMINDQSYENGNMMDDVESLRDFRRAIKDVVSAYAVITLSEQD